ncbi:MAG: efflux RND transporter periplasmic adaptor subunit [Bacteroidales bacterium]
MKRILIISGVVVAIAALIVFNKMTTKNSIPNTFANVKKGLFEIIVTNSGELIAERSVDIKGPEISPGSDRVFQGMGHGMRAMDLKIQDIVPEGTIVKEGDYIAQLDRSSYSNTLKDELENLKTIQNNVDMKILDTAVVLTNQRDDIRNQRYAVEEASITLEQSKFEPPATIRQAEIARDKAKRTLEQKIKGYSLVVAQNLADLNHLKMHLSRQTRLVNDLQEFLGKFTITAPSSGMVIYKKDRTGTKRKAGSTINPFDRVIATLPDLSSLISEVYINEIEISKVKIGQKANITIDAFPGKTFTGSVFSIANIGEQLPNSDSKMFEVQLKVDGSDPALRPSMTTGNKIVIKIYNDAVYIPAECVHTGIDSIPFVYLKNKTRQVVFLGESNEKNIIVVKGLEPGTPIYISRPENSEEFKLVGEDLIPLIKANK